MMKTKILHNTAIQTVLTFLLFLSTTCLQIETYHHAQKKLNLSCGNILETSKDSDILLANLFENPSIFQVINYTSSQLVGYFQMEYDIESMLLVNNTVGLFGGFSLVELYDFDQQLSLGKIDNVSGVKQLVPLENGLYAGTNQISLFVFDFNSNSIISYNNFESYINIESVMGVGLEDIILVATETNQVLYWNLTSNQNTDFFGESSAYNQVKLTQLNQSTKIASTQFSSTIIIWDVKTKEIYQSFAGNEQITEIIQVKNSNILITLHYHKQMKVWDIETGDIINVFNSFKYISNIAPTSDKDLLALSLDHNISIISISEQKQMSLVLGQHNKQINLIQQHLKYEDVIITASDDYQLKAWNITNFELLETFIGTNQISNFIQHPQTGEIVIIQIDTVIHKWNISINGQLSNSMTFHQQLDDTFSFSSLLLNNSNRILISTSQNILKFDLESEEYDDNFQIPVINCLSLIELPDNLISIGQFSSILQIYNYSSSQNESLIPTSIFNGISNQLYNGETTTLIISGYYNGIELRNCSNNYSLITILLGHEQPVFGLSLYKFSQRTYLLTGGWDSSILLWELQSFTSIKHFNNFPSYKVLALKNSDLVVCADKSGDLEMFSQSVVCEGKLCECDGVQGWVEWIAGVPVCIRVKQVLTEFTVQNAQYLVFQITLDQEWQAVVSAIIDNQMQLAVQIADWEQNEVRAVVWSEAPNVLSFRLDIINRTREINKGDLMVISIPYEYGLIDAHYNLTNYQWNYEFSIEKQFCPLGQYSASNGECKDQIELKPRLELTTSSKRLKLQFFNDEDLSFLKKIIKYITVDSIEGYSKDSYVYNITQSSESTTIFYIDFCFSSQILNNPLATILINIESTEDFLSNQLIISEKQLQINLMNWREYNEEVYESLSTISSSCYYGVYIGSIVSGITGNSGALSSFFILGLIELLKYQQLNYEEYIWKFFENKEGIVKTLKKFIQVREDIEDSEQIPPSLKKYQISCYFINNYIIDFLQIAIFWILAIIIKKINNIIKSKTSKKSKIRSIIKSIHKSFVWTIVYLFLFKSFLNGWVFTWIELFYFPIHSTFGKINFVIANLMLFLLSYLIIHVVIIVRIKKLSNDPSSPLISKMPINLRAKTQCRIFQRIKQLFIKIYQSGLQSIKLIDKFIGRHKIILGQEKKESVLIKYNFLEFELIRLFYISFVMIALQEQVLLQSILNILFLLFYYLNLIIKGIKQISFYFILQLIVEFFIILAYSGVFLYAQYKINGKANNIYVEEKLQQLIVIGIMGVTVCQLVTVVVSLLKSILGILAKMKKRKEIKSIKVMEIESPELKPTAPLNEGEVQKKW